MSPDIKGLYPLLNFMETPRFFEKKKKKKQSNKGRRKNSYPLGKLGDIIKEILEVTTLVPPSQWTEAVYIGV